MSRDEIKPLTTRPKQWSEEIGRKEIAKRVWRRLVARQPRKGIVDEIAFILDCAYSAGYMDAHDCQTNMRIQDAKECREKHGGLR